MGDEGSRSSVALGDRRAQSCPKGPCAQREGATACANTEWLRLLERGDVRQPEPRVAWPVDRLRERMGTRPGRVRGAVAPGHQQPWEGEARVRAGAPRTAATGDGRAVVPDLRAAHPAGGNGRRRAVPAGAARVRSRAVAGADRDDAP